MLLVHLLFSTSHALGVFFFSYGLALWYGSLRVADGDTNGETASDVHSLLQLRQGYRTVLNDSLRNVLLRFLASLN